MGITYILFTPSEFLEKNTALIPPPRQHQMSPKFSDVAVLRPIHLISPRSALSQKPKKGLDFADKDGDLGRPHNAKWARNLAQSFGIDILKCNHCRGSLKPIAALTDPDAIKRYLTHVGLGYLAAS